MNFKKIIEISLALSGKHPGNQRCKHFTFIYEKNKLLSIGINSSKTHPLNLKYNYINKQKDKISEIVGTHSEVSAVKKIGYGYCFDGLTLINTRVNRNNQIDYSKPCNGCMDMICELGFSKVFYTDKNAKFQLLIPTKELLLV
jgi:hypothetical protein